MTFLCFLERVFEIPRSQEPEALMQQAGNRLRKDSFAFCRDGLALTMGNLRVLEAA